MLQIKNLLEISMEVIADGCLENGAIVAANSFKNYYSSEAKNYFYVWPRDGSYISIASDILGLENIQENFFNWCLKRAEGFRDSGLFFGKYYVNGLKAHYGFQPDQTGSVLFALWHHYQDNLEDARKFEDLIKKGADGLARIWNADCFDLVATDLWEERLAFPDLAENFTYSLAACIRGLKCAGEMIPEEADKWWEVAEEMRMRLDEHFIDDHFVRSFGKLIDKRIDASVLALVYPFAIYEADAPEIVSTVKEIESRLVVDGGVHRYEHDEYDGWMFEGMHRKKGAGAWPILNFWLSIYWIQRGDTRRAKQFYDWVIERTDGHIPEQIFDNGIQISVSPLLWSHAMFVIASSFLGYR